MKNYINKLFKKKVLSNSKDQEFNKILNSTDISKLFECINNYSAKVIYNNPLPAPINTDTEYGKLIIQNTFRGDLEYPLYAKESIKKAGIFKKISSALSFFIFGGYAE